MNLVHDVHTIWRRWSSRIAASQAGLALFWVGMPDEWRAAIPPTALMVIVAIFAACFIGAQAVPQKNLKRPTNGDN